MHQESCIGDRANIYNMAEVEIKARAVVAQESYLCTGTHDFDSPVLALRVGKITIGEDVFLGARTFILPGVEVGSGAVVGACSVVTADVPAWTINAGNPCRMMRLRTRPPLHS